MIKPVVKTRLYCQTAKVPSTRASTKNHLKELFATERTLLPNRRAKISQCDARRTVLKNIFGQRFGKTCFSLSCPNFI